MNTNGLFGDKNFTSFCVSATMDPGAMPRVMEVFAKESLIPTRWTSFVENNNLMIDIQMDGLLPARAEYFARVIRNIPMVENVLSSTKASPPDRHGILSTNQ